MTNSDTQKCIAVVKRLEKCFGVPRRKRDTDPLSDLMRTVLSQSTNDRNRDVAYEALIERFSTWHEVMRAPATAIAEAIRPAGLSNQKSVRLKTILQWIYNTYGTLDINFICDMDIDEVSETFMTQKGIGIKTISVVLMFSCGRDVFPVDTHVFRLCKRLGFVPDNFTAEKTHYAMRDIVPTGKAYSLHMNMLKLGRTICTARNPACPGCPLKNLCDFAHSSSAT